MPAFRFGSSIELEPYFMRRSLVKMLVPDELRKCVVFIGIKNESGVFEPKGTAFLVSLVHQQHRVAFVVTAEHVISNINKRKNMIWARTNTKDGGIEEQELPYGNWWYHPQIESDPADVAVCQVGIDGSTDALTIPLSQSESIAATAEVLQRERIGIGEELVIVGLFRSHYGKQRNIPIIRVGNIAAMPEEPVYTDYCGLMSAFLIEARSIGGLSGSPVFVSLPPSRIIDNQIRPTAGAQFYLLGLVHGHFDVKNLNEDSVNDAIQEGRDAINTGIGVVVPVTKIIETILHPNFIDEFERSVIELRKAKGAVAD